MKKQKGFTAIELLIAAVMLVGSVGWVLNIYKLATFGGAFMDMGVMEILRIIGIVVAPLGVVLGFL